MLPWSQATTTETITREYDPQGKTTSTKTRPKKEDSGRKQAKTYSTTRHMRRRLSCFRVLWPRTLTIGAALTTLTLLHDSVRASAFCLVSTPTCTVPLVRRGMRVTYVVVSFFFLAWQTSWPQETNEDEEGKTVRDRWDKLRKATSQHKAPVNIKVNHYVARSARSSFVSPDILTTWP